ncbi:MAG: isocitrate lyase/phosphoenolpyruvate mutase family protein [Rhodospirillaceae bacterium]|nr:isocitrate lyase/phosphoenolpyruvate mutase family protein [Rhodospirillaceae bacterium]
MPNDIAAIATAFHKLHDEEGTFVIPNPWDRGSARMLKSLGFKALATTSAGFDFAEGRKEGTATLDDVLAHCRLIAEATDLPVNADTESGYAETPEGVAENIHRLAATGIAGCSIEDVNVYGPGVYGGAPIYDLPVAAERVAAAAEAVRNLGRPFVLTGRAENYLHGRPDLADTIKRLQAYQDAGADVLYAPGPRTAEDIRVIVTSVDRPVNVIAGLPGMNLSVTDLAELGVKRISVGSNLFRTAFAAALRGAQEIAEEGTFSYAGSAATFKEISGLFDD